MNIGWVISEQLKIGEARLHMLIHDGVNIMKRKEITNHAEWVDTIRKRGEDLNENWTPFIQNIEDVCDRIKVLHERIDELDNDIGETQGMIKNLRKILIKLEVLEDRFVF